MLTINPINNTKAQSPAFKSVRIAKEIYPANTYKMLMSIVQDGEKGKVQFININSGIESVLGHSKDAVTLEGMLEHLGKNIIKDEKYVSG